MKLGVGELSIGVLVKGSDTVREVRVPMLDGVPAYLAAPNNAPVMQFARGYRESVLGLTEHPEPGGFGNGGDGRGITDYFRVRRALSQETIVGPGHRAQVSGDLVKAMSVAFNKQHLTCVDAQTGGQLGCALSRSPWRGETEFESERNKQAYATTAAKVLSAAYARDLTFYLLEQRDLGTYESGAFRFSPAIHSGVLTQMRAGEAGSDAGYQGLFEGNGLLLPSVTPEQLTMPPNKAEAWARALQEQNSKDGLRRRTVFTLTKLQCSFAKARPNGPVPCTVLGYAVYSDALMRDKAPI